MPSEGKDLTSLGHSCLLVEEQVKYVISVHGFNGRPISFRACNIFTQIPYKPEYHGYFVAGESELCLGLITVPFSFADNLEDWEPQPKGLSRPVMGEF